LDFQQTDSAADVLGSDVYCSGETTVIATPVALKAIDGGTAGTASQSLNQDNPGANEVVGGWEINGDGLAWDAGSWSIPIRVTVGSSWLSAKRVDICQVRGGVSIASLGAWTGTTALTAGTKTFPVTGSEIASPQAGDKVVCILTVFNSSESPEGVTFVSDQVIVSPFTAAEVNRVPMFDGSGCLVIPPPEAVSV